MEPDGRSQAKAIPWWRLKLGHGARANPHLWHFSFLDVLSLVNCGFLPPPEVLLGLTLSLISGRNEAVHHPRTSQGGDGKVQSSEVGTLVPKETSP